MGFHVLSHCQIADVCTCIRALSGTSNLSVLCLGPSAGIQLGRESKLLAGSFVVLVPLMWAMVGLLFRCSSSILVLISEITSHSESRVTFGKCLLFPPTFDCHVDHALAVTDQVVRL
jgi:hypothetical protein